MNKNLVKIYKKALELWGKQMQVTMVFEEFAELQLLLAKDLRGRSVHEWNIAEEIADCMIMLEQMSIIYRIEDRVIRVKAIKINRLINRIMEAEKKRNERNQES